MDAAAFARTMRILEARHPMEDWSEGRTAFEILVSTILSQSTTVSNERRGRAGLREKFGAITPERLADAPVRDIANAIWHAGLARQKAPRIRAAGRRVMEERGGNLKGILSRPTLEARDALLSLPGVGPKTADVVLAMAGGHATFPVDTHIARIARRWRLADRGGYEATRAALERLTPPAKRKAWHLAIIAHGRELCRARNPLCGECPVARDCDWYQSGKRGRGGDKRLRASKA